ncbi:hypothetical protein FRB94_004134 [Tulasnella sp. JGI-2019a]|nr:hypothetical protein FRB94_004134 [Tulasnella sp. JGI-2019a]KAG9016833.1 hypothetical protein FRB93_009362 [Tulasnella sp. JGI-2019a]
MKRAVSVTVRSCRATSSRSSSSAAAVLKQPENDSPPTRWRSQQTPGKWDRPQPSHLSVRPRSAFDSSSSSSGRQSDRPFYPPRNERQLSDNSLPGRRPSSGPLRDPPSSSGARVSDQSRSRVQNQPRRQWDVGNSSSSASSSASFGQANPQIRGRWDPRGSRDEPQYRTAPSLDSRQQLDRGGTGAGFRTSAQTATGSRWQSDRPGNERPSAFERSGDREPTVRPKEQRANVLDKTLERLTQQAMEEDEVKPKIGLKTKAPKKVKVVQEAKKVENDVFIPNTISIGQLAKLLRVKRETLEIIMQDSDMGQANFDRVLQADDACMLAMELQFNPIVDDAAAFDIYPSPIPTDKTALPLRPPIVTIMGHVDHGKTTLLDTLRSASVASGESGGITQHIGAFSVPIKSLSVGSTPMSSTDAPKSVTFLDTPGHAAFSAMRARGATVTDIVVLVVAADDGVMPQTREVIELVKRDSSLQLVVAINKCDKPGVDTEKIKNDLLQEGVQLEDLGGDIPSVEVSGLTGQGLDSLMETITLVAELADLRAEKGICAHGHVLEANLDKGRGPIATVLVSRGTLKNGDHILAGTSWAKVRQMTDDRGNHVSSAPPGTPVIVAGWKSLPVAGDEVLTASTGRKAADDVKRAVNNREREKANEALMIDVASINEKRAMEKRRRVQINADAVEASRLYKTGLRKGKMRAESEAPESVYAMSQSQRDDGVKQLRLIVKADVSGTIEAVVGAISSLGNKEVKVVVIQSGVGDVTESDVTMAEASQAMVLGFNVSASRSIEAAASSSNVPIHVDTVIYRLMDEVKSRLVAMLPPIIEKRVVGEAKVQQIFEINRKGGSNLNIAGCRVINGLVEKHKTARVVRDGQTVAEGNLSALKHLKKDMTEVRKGMECGVVIDGFGDFKEGDLIQTYSIIETPATL